MYEKQAVIKSRLGIHARPASIIAKSAAAFPCEITLQRKDGGRTVNMKSMPYILSLGLEQGAQVVISANGNQEKEAVEKLVQLMETDFDE
jgi:phosphocarrier protein HPr